MVLGAVLYLCLNMKDINSWPSLVSLCLCDAVFFGWLHGPGNVYSFLRMPSLVPLLLPVHHLVPKCTHMRAGVLWRVWRLHLPSVFTYLSTYNPTFRNDGKSCFIQCFVKYGSIFPVHHLVPDVPTRMQVFFGVCGDYLGRKRIYLVTLVIMIVATIGQALSASPIRGWGCADPCSLIPTP